MHTRHARHGFSLIELMVTMAILALVVMASIPSFSTWMRNTQVRTAAESLQAGLQKARAEAVRRNEPVSFWLVANAVPTVLDASCTLSTTSASWVVAINNPAGLCDRAPSATQAPKLIDKHPRGESGSQVSVTVFAEDCVTPVNSSQTRFNGFGQVVAAGGDAIRCLQIDHISGLEARRLRIAISNGGSVRMCDPAVVSDADPRKCY